MLQYYKLTDDDRICFTADSPYTVVKEDGEIVSEGEQFDFPEDFDFLEQQNYKIVDGELVYAPVPETEDTPTPTTEERIDELEEALDMLLSGVTE